MLARVKAFSTHLLLSIFVALAVVFWVFTVWYPAPLHQALAVTHIFILLIAVDIVLGPLLTLVVFKPAKKKLAVDLAVILTLQLSALAYGLWTVSEGRPAWLVFNVDRFDVVQIVDIDVRRLDLAAAEYQTPSLFGPKWVGADRPTNREQRNDILQESLSGGPDIAQRPFLYRPLNEFKSVMQSRAQPLERLGEYNEAESVKEILSDWPQASGWVPLKARSQSMVVLLMEDDTKVLSIVPLHPW